MNKNNYCIIMAGGVGTRFWPMSRSAHPKQFIDILGTGESLLQQTVNRFHNICPPENIFIVTNEIYYSLVKEQIKGINDNQILLEPARRNTAPCIAYAAYKIHDINPDANIVVAPSDHIILKEDNFTEVILSCLEATKKHKWLLTLGITPSRPDTGYGYIQFDDSDTSEQGINKVKTFTEKPVLEMAQQFLQSGDFLWNAGIFIWSLSSILEALEKQLPEISSLFKEGAGKYNTKSESDFIRETYAVCKSISIDYGVMEKAENVYVKAADFGWSDLGTWRSLYEIREKNIDGNALVGRNIMLYNTKNCIINMPKEKLVVIEGLEDYIVVENDNILLICKKTDEQLIRQFVNDVTVEKGDKFV
ncbi:MAG: mannose-1-phosphate guanylyltransferase [Bacteroidota bacterium]